MSIVNALKISRRPAVAFAIVGIYWGMFAAHVPVLKAQVGVDDALFGLLLLGTGVGLTSAMWLAPRFDRLMGRASLQAASFLFIASFMLPALASGAVTFAISLVLVGAASGVLDVVMNARVSELEATHKHPMMNANHGMFSAGYALAALASGFTREGGLTPVVVFGGAMVIGAALALFARQDGVKFAPETGGGQGSALIPVLLCGGVVLIAFMSEATVEIWSALHIERTLAGGAAQGATGPAVLGLTMAVGRFGGQIITEKLGQITLIFWATLLSVLGALIAAVAPVPALAYLGFGVLGLGISVIGPVGIAMVGQMVRPELRVQAISQVTVIGFAGFFVAPVLMGVLSQAFGLRVAFACVALMLLLELPLISAIRRLRGV